MRGRARRLDPSSRICRPCGRTGSPLGGRPSGGAATIRTCRLDRRLRGLLRGRRTGRLAAATRGRRSRRGLEKLRCLLLVGSRPSHRHGVLRRLAVDRFGSRTLLGRRTVSDLLPSLGRYVDVSLVPTFGPAHLTGGHPARRHLGTCALDNRLCVGPVLRFRCAGSQGGGAIADPPGIGVTRRRRSGGRRGRGRCSCSSRFAGHPVPGGRLVGHRLARSTRLRGHRRGWCGRGRGACRYALGRDADGHHGRTRCTGGRRCGCRGRRRGPGPRRRRTCCRRRGASRRPCRRAGFRRGWSRCGRPGRSGSRTGRRTSSRSGTHGGRTRSSNRTASPSTGRSSTRGNGRSRSRGRRRRPPHGLSGTRGGTGRGRSCGGGRMCTRSGHRRDNGRRLTVGRRLRGLRRRRRLRGHRSSSRPPGFTRRLAYRAARGVAARPTTGTTRPPGEDATAPGRSSTRSRLHIRANTRTGRGRCGRGSGSSSRGGSCRGSSRSSTRGGSGRGSSGSGRGSGGRGSGGSGRGSGGSRGSSSRGRNNGRGGGGRRRSGGTGTGSISSTRGVVPARLLLGDRLRFCGAVTAVHGAGGP